MENLQHDIFTYNLHKDSYFTHFITHLYFSLDPNYQDYSNQYDPSNFKIELDQQPGMQILDSPLLNPLLPPPIPAQPLIENSHSSSKNDSHSSGTFEDEKSEPVKEKKLRKKRGKYKKKNKYNEDPNERENIRLERNRRSAKECRQRKKQYIGQLEKEVARLNSEIDVYKQKLATYEKIERYRSTASLSTFQLLKENHLQSLFKITEDSSSNPLRSRLLGLSYLECAERNQVLHQLSKTTIEVMLPATHKYLLWASENNTSIFRPENFEALETGILPKPKDEWDEFLHQVHFNDADLELMEHYKPMFTNLSMEFKKLVKQYLNIEKQMQQQIKCMDTIVEDIFIKVSQPTLCAFVAWFEKVFFLRNNKKDER